jgi:hypothetical protein
MTVLNNELTRIGRKVSKNNIKLDEIKNIANLDLDPIGKGEGRSVFKLNDYDDEVVVKFAHNSDRYTGGIDQNRYESAIWRDSTPEQKKYLTPVIKSDKNGLWLIMKYANPVPEDCDLEKTRDEIYDLFGEKIDTAYRRYNFGLIDGTIKLVDYGYTMKI